MLDYNVKNNISRALNFFTCRCRLTHYIVNNIKKAFMSRYLDICTKEKKKVADAFLQTTFNTKKSFSRKFWFNKIMRVFCNHKLYFIIWVSTFIYWFAGNPTLILHSNKIGIKTINTFCFDESLPVLTKWKQKHICIKRWYMLDITYCSLCMPFFNIIFLHFETYFYDLFTFY